MRTAISTNETERLKDIRRLQILDTLPEQDFDDITRLASQICGTPVSLISIIDSDRQWFKSKVGLEVDETPRNLAFCNYAIATPNEMMEVEDARKDDRFSSNPFVTADENPVISYTGIPLVSDRGYALGTLCTIDHEPKVLNEAQKEALQILASQVVRIFELRKANIDLESVSKEITKRYEELEMFAGVVSHDMKSPLANIILTVETLKKKLDMYDLEDSSVDTYMGYLKNSAKSMSGYIQGMLDYYKSDHTSHDDTEEVALIPYLTKLVTMLDIDPSHEVVLPENDTMIHVNKNALSQILLNIITNSIKYNDKAILKLAIGFQEDKKFYTFTIKDNGPGIKPEDCEKIFELFNNLNATDNQGKKGTGIGLATVKKLIDGMDGNIEVSSVLCNCTVFTVNIPKPFEMTLNK